MDSSDESVDGWAFVKIKNAMEATDHSLTCNLQQEESASSENDITKFNESRNIEKTWTDGCEANKLELDSHSSSSEFDIIDFTHELQLQHVDSVESVQDLQQQQLGLIDFLELKNQQIGHQPDAFMHLPALNHHNDALESSQKPQLQLHSSIESQQLGQHEFLDKTANIHFNISVENVPIFDEGAGIVAEDVKVADESSDFEVLWPSNIKADDMLNVCEMWDNYEPTSQLPSASTAATNLSSENVLSILTNLDLNVVNDKDAKILGDQIDENITLKEAIKDVSTSSCTNIESGTEVGYKVGIDICEAEVDNSQMVNTEVDYRQLFDIFYDASDPELIVQKFHEIVRLRKTSEKNNQRQQPVDDPLLGPDTDDRCESEMSLGDSWDLSTWSGSVELGEGLDVSGARSRMRAYRHQPNPVLDHRLNILAISALIFTAGVAIGHYCGSNFNFRIKQTGHPPFTKTTVSLVTMVTTSHPECLMKDSCVVAEKPYATLTTLNNVAKEINTNIIRPSLTTQTRGSLINPIVSKEFLEFAEMRKFMNGNYHNLYTMNLKNDSGKVAWHTDFHQQAHGVPAVSNQVVVEVNGGEKHLSLTKESNPLKKPARKFEKASDGGEAAWGLEEGNDKDGGRKLKGNKDEDKRELEGGKNWYLVQWNDLEKKGIQKHNAYDLTEHKNQVEHRHINAYKSNQRGVKSKGDSQYEDHTYGAHISNTKQSKGSWYIDKLDRINEHATQDFNVDAKYKRQQFRRSRGQFESMQPGYTHKRGSDASDQHRYKLKDLKVDGEKGRSWGRDLIDQVWQQSKIFADNFPGKKWKNLFKRIKNFAKHLMRFNESKGNSLMILNESEESEMREDVEQLMRETKLLKFLPKNIRKFLFCQHKYFLARKELLGKVSLVVDCEDKLFKWQLKRICLHFANNCCPRSTHKKPKNRYCHQSIMGDQGQYSCHACSKNKRVEALSKICFDGYGILICDLD